MMVPRISGEVAANYRGISWELPNWPDYLRFRDDLAGILDPRFYTIRWLDGEIWSGRIRLFSGPKSCILVSLKVYPTGLKECHVEAAAGELSELVSTTIRRVEEWAQQQGCSTIVIQSREGWLKVMKSSGYSPYQTAIRKELP